MFNVIFKVRTDFNVSPNELIPINSEYVFDGNGCSFGSLSKTNIFIGENNSGKSRFLRFLFQSDYLCINDENIEKFYSTMRSSIGSKVLDDMYGFEKFNSIYDIAKQDHNRYHNSYDPSLR